MNWKLALSTILFTALPALSGAAPLPQPGDAATIATVNGTKITEWTLQRYALQRGVQGELQGEQRQAFVEELINRELIFQDAVSIGIDKTPLIQAEVEHQRINIVASAMLNRSSDRFQVSDEEMKQEYENRKGELGGTEMKARHILLESEQDAREVIAELDKGGDFAKLAGERSKGPSAMSGGDLGWFKPDQMVPPFSAAAAKLAKGSYTKAPVQTQFGWHVILLEDKRTIQPPSFASVKEQIRVGLQNKLIEDYIRELRNKAKIDR
jgi:peptidyl-prolyl cis-trans isomerase C